MRTIPVEHTSAQRLRFLAGALALLGWSLLLLRLLRLAAEQPDLLSGVEAMLVRFSQYFTLQTNCFASLILTRYALGPGGRRGAWLSSPAAATSAAASMLLVALVYQLLLAHLWDPRGWDRVADVGLHYVMPGLTVLYWWLALPAGCLTWRDLPRTWIFPLGYLCWVLLQASLWNHYPYPFLNSEELGPWRVAGNIGLLFLTFNVAASGLILAKHRRRAERARISV
jgi:hypothetical protein